MFTWSIQSTKDGNGSSCTVFFQDNGRVLTADNNHPNYRKIVSLVQDPDQLDWDDDVDQTLLDLFDATIAVGTKFQQLSDRVSVAAGRIYFDHVEVNDVLAAQVLDFHTQGHDFLPLVKFWEKIATNPTEHSREHLYRWLKAQGDFTIDDDGDLIAYKGLNPNGTSIHAGPAIVDGVAMNGHVPNNPGSRIQMARDKVDHDPAQGCSVGLHAGTFQYASGFGNGMTAKVKINPRDVVSVPTDSGDAKMRVCDYLVLEQVKAPEPSRLNGHVDEEYGLEEELDQLEAELDEQDDYGDTVEVPTGSLRAILGTIRGLIRGEDR